MFQRDPRAGAFLGGDRISGQDIRDQNGARPYEHRTRKDWIVLMRPCSHRSADDREYRQELAWPAWT